MRQMAVASGWPALALIVGLAAGGCVEPLPESQPAVRAELALLALEGGVEWPPAGVVGLRLTVKPKGQPSASQTFYDLDRTDYTVTGVAPAPEATVVAELLEADGWASWYGKAGKVAVVAGEESSVAITLRPTPRPGKSEQPEQSAIAFPDGMTHTRELTVKLLLAATGASAVELANDGDFQQSQTVPFAESVSWTLKDGPDGERTVHCRFLDDAGNASRPQSASIILDRQPPEKAMLLAETTLATASGEGWVKATRQRTVSVYALVQDASEMLIHSQELGSKLPGIEEAWLVEGEEPVLLSLHEWLPYRPRMAMILTADPGDHALLISFRDKAGNSTPEPAREVVSLLPPVAAPTLLPEYDGPVCHVPAGATGSAAPGGWLVMGGEAPPGVTLKEALLLWHETGESPLEGAELEVPKNAVKLEEGVLSGKVKLPGYLPDGARVSALVRVRQSEVSPDGKSLNQASDDEESLSLPVVVDAVPPQIAGCELLSAVVSEPQVPVKLSVSGGCVVRVMEKEGGQEVGWVAAGEGEIFVQVALTGQKADGLREVVAEALDSAGNKAQLHCGDVLLKQNEPQVVGLEVKPEVPSPLDPMTVKPGDMIQTFAATDGETLIDAVVEWSDGAVAPVAGLLLADGALGGAFSMPAHPGKAAEGMSWRLGIRLSGSWGVENSGLQYSLADLLYDDVPPAIVEAVATNDSAMGCLSTTELLLEVTAAGASAMRLSGDVTVEGDWTAIDEKAFAALTLTPGEGLKEIVVELADGAGNLALRTVVVRLDSLPPDPAEVALANPLVHGLYLGGYFVTALPALSLTVSDPQDDGCGPVQLRILPHDPPGGIVATGWLPFVGSAKLAFAGGDGIRTACVQLRDGLGNQSLCEGKFLLTAVRDSSPPTAGKLLVAQEKEGLVDSCQPQFMVAAEEQSPLPAGQSPVWVRLGGDLAGGATEWTPLSTADPWTLFELELAAAPCAGQGQAIVHASFRDALGNQSPAVAAQVKVNTGLPTTPELLPLSPLVTTAPAFLALRGPAPDEDFAGVERLVCPWCTQEDPTLCTCTKEPATGEQVLSFPLPEADADYRLCIRALDLFGQAAEGYECIEAVRDSTPPVTALHCWDDLDQDGQLSAGESRPCPGGRHSLEQEFVLAVGERNQPDAVKTMLGAGGGDEGSALAYDGQPFLAGTPVELDSWSSDLAGNQEEPRRHALAFAFDHHQVELGMGAFHTVSVTTLDDGDFLVVGGAPGPAPSRDRWAVLSHHDLHTVRPSDPAAGHDPLAHSELHTANRLSDGRVVFFGGGTRLHPQALMTMRPDLRIFSALGVPESSMVHGLPPRAHHAAAAVGQKLVIHGGIGQNGSVLDDLIVIDASDWSATVVATGVARMGHSAVTLDDGQVLFIGGADGDNHSTPTLIRVDPDSPAAWQSEEAAMEPRALHQSLKLVDGSVLVVGGIANLVPFSYYFLSDVVTSAALLAPDGSLVMEEPNLVLPGLSPALVQLADETILIAGGFAQSGIQNQALIISPDLEVRSFLSEIGGGRAGSAGVALANGSPAMLGGATHPLFEIHSDAVIFQRDRGWHSTATHAATRRRDFTATQLVDERIFIAGGRGASATLATGALLDPLGRVTSQFQSPLLRRERHNALLLPSGNVLLAGGQRTDAAGLKPVAEAAIFTPGGGLLQQATHPALGRVDGPVALAGGGLLLFGGALVAGGEPLASIARLGLTGDGLIATAADGSPQVTELPWPAGAARAGATLSRLDDGRLLVAGGCQGAGGPLDEALLFELGADGLPALAAQTGSIGGGRCRHRAAVLLDGRVVLAGGDTAGPGAAPAVVLAGSGPNTGQWLADLPLDGHRVGHELTVLPRGDLLLWGGRNPAGSEAAPELATTALLLIPDLGETATVLLLGQAGFGQALVPTLAGQTLAIGGQGAKGLLGEIRMFTDRDGQLFPGHLYHGAKVAGDSSKPTAGWPAGNRIVPPASCAGNKLQLGPDHAFRLLVRPDEKLILRAVPLQPDLDLSIYLVSRPERRDGGFCYAGVDLLGAGKPELLTVDGGQLGDSRQLYVVVDSPMPPGGQYEVRVLKNLAELTYQGGNP